MNQTSKKWNFNGLTLKICWELFTQNSSMLTKYFQYQCQWHQPTFWNDARQSTEQIGDSSEHLYFRFCNFLYVTNVKCSSNVSHLHITEIKFRIVMRGVEFIGIFYEYNICVFYNQMRRSFFKPKIINKVLIMRFH